MMPFQAMRLRAAGGGTSSPTISLRVAGTTVINGSGTTVSLSPGAGTQVGDLLVAAIMRRSLPASDPPSGWSLLSSSPGVTDSGVTQYTHVYMKVATSGDLSTPTVFSQTSSGRCAGQMLSLTSIGTISMESQASGTASGGVSTVALPVITAAGSNRFAVGVASTVLTVGGLSGATVNNGFTVRTPDSSDYRLSLVTKSLPSGGDTTATITFAGGEGAFTRNALIFVAA